MAYTPDQFVEVLKSVAVETAKEAHKVLADVAEDVQDQARRNARAANPSHAKNVHRYINRDIDGLTAEIGYDKVDQGNLGAVLEYGNGRAHNAPQRNLGRALDAHEERFAQRLADAAERVLRG